MIEKNNSIEVLKLTPARLQIGPQWKGTSYDTV